MNDPLSNRQLQRRNAQTAFVAAWGFLLTCCGLYWAHTHRMTVRLIEAGPAVVPVPSREWLLPSALYFVAISVVMTAQIIIVEGERAQGER